MASLSSALHSLVRALSNASTPGWGMGWRGGCSAPERERGRERGEHFILAGGCQEGGTRAACSAHAHGKHPNVISIPAHANTLPDVRRSVEAYARFNDRMLTLTRSQQQQQKASAGSSQLTSDDDDDDDDDGKTSGFTGVLLPSASDRRQRSDGCPVECRRGSWLQSFTPEHSPESLSTECVCVCVCRAGQGCPGESESTAEAAGRGQVQPRHAGLHHERRL